MDTIDVLNDQAFPIAVPGATGVLTADGRLVVRDNATGAESPMSDSQVQAELVAIGKGHALQRTPYEQRAILGLHARMGPHTIDQPTRHDTAHGSTGDVTDDELAAIGQAQGEAFRDQLLRQRGEPTQEQIDANLARTALGRKFLASRAATTPDDARVDNTLAMTALGRKYLAARDQR